jgi:GNAT superfamily N-acetyltransferase
LPAVDGDVRRLAELLIEAVESQAAVSFLSPLSVERSEAWWRDTLKQAEGGRAVVLVARSEGRVLGTVQLQPAWAPNQPHRAEVCKLIVGREVQGRGVGSALMRAAEAQALQNGWTLLTLDARGDGPACPLYRKLGWVEVGAIPRFAINPDGKGFHETVIFYKELGTPTLPNS